jgi:O-antigen/teichoic acid export membrane protein
MLNFTKKLIEKYFVDSFFLNFPRFIVILVELATIPITLANLSIKDFGFFSFVLALQLWITTLTAGHITAASKRGISRGLEGTFLFAFFVRLKILLVVGLIVFIVSFLLYLLIPGTLFLLIIIMAIFLIFGYLPQVSYGIFLIAKKKFKKSAIWQILLPVSTSLAFTLSAFLTHNILICTIVYFGSITFISWLGFLHLVFKNNLFSAYKKNKIDRECVPYGLKLIPASLVQQTSSQITNFIIGPFFGFANLAIFSVAFGLLDKFRGFTKTLDNLFYADFARSNQDKLIKKIKSKLGQGIFISIILTLFCVFLGFTYIHFFLPESYQQTKTYFLILSFSLPAVILESILATVLMANLRHKELTISLILPNLIKIILIFISGILFKIIGICWAVVLGAWISLAFYYSLTISKSSYSDYRLNY